jgi:hypothetical protein
MLKILDIQLLLFIKLAHSLVATGEFWIDTQRPAAGLYLQGIDSVVKCLQYCYQVLLEVRSIGHMGVVISIQLYDGVVVKQRLV